MDVQNDKALDIALGNSRKTKTWKNKTVQWSELLDRLSAVTRTPETMAEYKAMTRVQESFEEENPREGIVQEYLERLLPEDWDTMDLPARRLWLEGTQEGTVRRRTVCTMEIWAEALGGCPDRLDRYDGKEIREIMERLPGWRHHGDQRLTIRPYGRQRFYERRREA